MIAPAEWLAALAAIGAAGIGGGFLARMVLRRQEGAKLTAEARKLEAEADSIEGGAWATQVRQAIELLEVYRKDVVELRRQLAAMELSLEAMEGHVGELEALLREAGLRVPRRPSRPAG